MPRKRHCTLDDEPRDGARTRGITANAVAPGFIPDTEFWEGRLSDEVVSSRVTQTPAGRPGTPAEVAEAVAYLAPGCRFTTGQILQVNGGWMLGRG